MRTRLLTGGVAAVVVAAAVTLSAWNAVPAAGADCSDLVALTIPDVTIASATSVAAGLFSPAGGRGGGAVVPAFCRVVAVAAPSADSKINIEIWIPSGAAWNGKLLGTANGGFSGAIPHAPMAAGLAKGNTPLSGLTQDTRAIRWSLASVIPRRSSTGVIDRFT
jgi:feruloyl esterase